MRYSRPWVLVVLLFFTLIINSYALQPIGIITAVPSEATWIKQQISQPKSISCGIYSCVKGKINQIPVVLLICGVGIVHAAVATTQLIEHEHPRFILFSGTAGSLRHHVNIGDVYLIRQATNIDQQWAENVLGKKKKPLAYNHTYQANEGLLRQVKANLNNKRLKSLSKDGKLIQTRIRVANIVTSAQFNLSYHDYKHLKKHHALIAMETASFYQVCHMLHHMPCLAFRTVSNILYPKKQTPFVAWNVNNATRAANNGGKILVRSLSILKTFGTRK